MKILLAIAMVFAITTPAYGSNYKKLDPILLEMVSNYEKTRKLSPLLLEALDEAIARKVPAKQIKLHALISMVNVHSESFARKIMAENGIKAHSVILGQYTIITAQTDLEKLFNITGLVNVIYIEGNNVLFPEPSFSLGN
jgi:hypothetical protein